MPENKSKEPRRPILTRKEQTLLAFILALLVVGGIVPDEDAQALVAQGITAVYTPKDFSLATIMDDLLGIVESL